MSVLPTTCESAFRDRLNLESVQIWAVTMVRNEQDVIGRTVQHLIAEGVDHVLIADNLSTDSTRNILNGLAATLPITVVDDPDPAYRQSEKMTALARRAGAAGADWIIPFDADELWLSTEGRLRDLLEAEQGVEVLEAELLRHYAPFWGARGPNLWARMRWRDDGPARFYKVAFVAADDVTLEMGNHSVTAPRPLRQRREPKLQVRHFQYRTFAQMARKTRQGRAAIELTDYSEGTCWHWRLHGRQSKWRMAISWARMSLGRRDRIADPCTPRSL